MKEENRSRPLSFDGKFVRAHLVERVRDYAANGVVTNLSNQAMIVAGDVPGVIPPWKSTILKGGTIAQAERVSIVDVPDPTNLGGSKKIAAAHFRSTGNMFGRTSWRTCATMLLMAW